MSDPTGPSPRITLPSVTDMHPDDPRRHASLLIVSAVERVAHQASLLISERMTPIMSALQDLTDAVQEEVDTIAVAVQQLANHSAVRSDGELTSLAQRIRNSTQTLKNAMASAAASDGGGTTSTTSGTSPEATSTVPGGGTETSAVDEAAAGTADLGSGSGSATSDTASAFTDRSGEPIASSSGGPSTSRRR